MDMEMECAWSLIEDLPNDIILEHIYSRLSPCDRAVAACLNKDWAELHQHLNCYGRLAQLIIYSRKLSLLPPVPSLIAFNEGCRHAYPVRERKSYGSWCFCSRQFFFDRNSSGRPQVHRFHDLTERTPWTIHDTYHYGSVGSTVFVIGYETEREEAFVGELESTHSWRWILTAAPTLLVVLDVDPSWCRRSVVVVGSMVIQIRITTMIDDEIVCLAHGSGYDLQSKQWSHLTVLSQPDDVADRVIMNSALAWNKKLFVTGWRYRDFYQYVYGERAGGPLHICSHYDFETQTWSPWNGTSQQLMLADALNRLHIMLGLPYVFSYSVRFVEATDGTLFAVISKRNVRTIVYFMRIDESVAGGFEWVNLPLPPLVAMDEKYYQTKVWPLEGNGGIAIISRVLFEHAWAAWWFLNTSGVYASGTFQRCNTCKYRSAPTQYVMIHTDI